MKRCLQSLRTLWRSSKARGVDDRVTHLKSFLLPSPERRQHRGNPLEDDRASDPEAYVSDHNEAGDDDGREQGEVSADENEVPDVSADESDDRGGDDRGGDDVSADEDVQEGLRSDNENGGNATGSEEENVSASPCEKSDSDGDECDADDGAVACSQGSHGSLSADTLRLPGAPTESDASSVSSGQDAVNEQGESDVEVVGEGEEEDQRDSQVPGAGWMGRGMMYWRFLEKEEKEAARREKELIKVLFDIKDGLCMALGSEEVNKHWPGYQFMCHQNLIHYGERIFDRLVDKDFFLRWAHTLNPSEKDRFSLQSLSLFIA